MEIGNCMSQKISFQVFCNDQKSKMQMKYPFLSKSQIHKKIKENWKKLDIKEKSSYTKTVYSSAKINKVKAQHTKKAQTAYTSQKSSTDNRNKLEERVDLVPKLQQDEDEDTEMKSAETNDLDHYHRNLENGHIKEKSTEEGLKEKPCRKTVPWKGRPSLEQSNLWSDSSSPDRISPKKAKLKKQKKVQSILKPSSDESKPLKSKNRVSFGSPQKNLSPNTSFPGNWGDCNTASSDEDNVQLLHRTDEDLYDFERIDNYELCVEKEDIYSNMFRQKSDSKPILQFQTDTDNQHTCQKKIPDFKIPQSMVSKKMRKGDEESVDKVDLGENLPSQSEETSQNPQVDLSTPMMTEKHVLSNFLVTPQMQRKLEDANKTPKKNKEHSTKASTEAEPDKRSTRRSLSSGARKEYSDKENTDSDSLSLTPLTESLTSGNEYLASQNFKGGEVDLDVFSVKTNILENVENDTNPSKVPLKLKSTTQQQRRKRRAKPKRTERLQDVSSPSSTDSALHPNNKKKRRPGMFKQTKGTNLEQSGSAQAHVRRQYKTQNRDKRTPSKPCEESKIVKSPIGRMDADRLISESPNKMDYIQNSPLQDSCLYLSENLSNDSESSFTIDGQQTNKVLLSAIFKMQQAVQYQNGCTSDNENVSSDLNESASWIYKSEDERPDSEEEVQSTNCKHQNSLNLICESEAEICTEASSDKLQESEAFTQEQLPIQMDIRDKELTLEEKDICKDSEKKPNPPAIQGHPREDVFQMFSNPTTSTTANIPSKRFIFSAQKESKSNFTDLFNEDDIF